MRCVLELGPIGLVVPWGLKQEQVDLSGSLSLPLGVLTKPGNLGGDGESPKAERGGVSLRPELASRYLTNHHPQEWPCQMHPLSWGAQVIAPTWAARACRAHSGAKAGGASPAWPAAATQGPEKRAQQREGGLGSPGGS